MLPVAEVTNPRLKRWRVVLLHEGAIGDEGSATGDGRPFARGGQEGDIDVRVGFEVVGLAGLGIGVEEEIDAVAFL